MAELKLDISPERLTVGDAIALEEGDWAEMGTRGMRDFLMRYMVNEDGSQPTQARAEAAMDKLPYGALLEAFTELTADMRETVEDAVDPPGGDSS